ncbi:SLC13 family permease [Mangrovibacillus sp. Mu-81]|uniref:SLC13 family permease n=1 Tax=Mangrovibacillus sp. Mu-81 TaxID=3121478 RepID=UPI002FE45616
MTIEIGFVLISIIIMMIGLIREWIRPDILVFITLAMFLITNVISVEDALSGFSNEGMLTIALLFIVAGAIQKSGIAERLIINLLDRQTGSKWLLAKILTPIAIFSGFMNNTPIVVTLTPILRKWCQDNGVSASKVLIPLSYATILGGTITLIGTSTNLVVHGLLKDAGFKGYSFFELCIIGIPITMIGILYITTIGYKLLPDYKNLTETVQERAKEYLAEVIVLEDFPFENQSIEVAGLRNLKGLFLVQIIRNNEVISPVKSSTKILQGDKLIFTGLLTTIAELQTMKGLHIETGSELNLNNLKDRNIKLVEAVISDQSSLLHKRINDSNFRSNYDASIIAVHRKNERIESKIGEIILKPGDHLLILGGSDFRKRADATTDFFVVTLINNPPQLENQAKGWFSIFTLLAMVTLVTFNVISMFKAMVLMVLILFLTKIITPEEAKHSIQFNVLLLIASAFGIGAALIESGTASWLAGLLTSMAKPLGTFGLLVIIYVITNIFTEIISNSAAAVLMFPIAIEISQQNQVEPMAFAVAITIAASAGFSTPIGYQTNLIVYGPGGYKFIDYLRVGIPLNIIVMLVSLFIIYFVWL